MRRSREEAAETRRAIVEAASRLFRERGIAAVSIAEVMGALGLTAGGFYRHFADKEALVGEAIDAASIETVAAMKEASKPAQGPARLGIILDRYLSREHLAHPGYGCPVAALAGGAAHEMKAAREALQRAVGRMLAMLEADGPGAKRERRRRLAALSSAVGALVLGRVLEGTPAGEEVIDSVRAELLADRR
jgi:TetR/AcrR family transcriptional regulator, transcriptional repressor for nem operon